MEETKMSFREQHFIARARVDAKIQFDPEDEDRVIIDLPQGGVLEMDLGLVPAPDRQDFARRLYSAAEELERKARKAGRVKLRSQLNELLNPVYE